MTPLAPHLDRRSWLTALLCSALPLWAQSPTWPAKPIKLTVAYPPGGVSDMVARALAEQLTTRLGMPVLVDNRAGAGGSLAVNAVAKSAPDGYSLVFTALSPLTLSPHLSSLPYDAVKDLTPVASVMYSPVLIAATPALTQGDFKALLARAKQQPDALRWATSGSGSLGHLMLENIRSSAQVRITHVPYKGGGQQITDALSGQFEILSTNASGVVLQHIKESRLRALAVGAAARLDALPGVPTLAELGFAAANFSSRFGIFAPSGVPSAIVEKLHAQINAVLALPALRERLIAAECVAAPASVADFAKAVSSEYKHMGSIVREAKIQAD
ncbi:tripartite tricarboxylate transporter substrate binding protein [Limnohabitans sp. T6-5]|uniref:Bug family tripartite tricarboxylate transporter substrate binding protein n=1 Tax=Limnohabitans sp. T6-5 TaxID=1100724 RepID=UPI001E63FAB8|nr:tripartite tricarboxylate transporter substrate binding protein [Limnohabitans sp. T6-5]